MFRRKPPGDIAQAVLGLMQDPAQWRSGFFCVRHNASELVVSNPGFWVRAVVGEARYTFEGRDKGVMDRAYHKLKGRMVKHRQAEAAGRLREALALPTPAPERVALPSATETVEQVEARVRQLREAVLRAAT